MLIARLEYGVIVVQILQVSFMFHKDGSLNVCREF